MNPSEASLSTQLKVGIFTFLGLLLVGVITVLVNDRPNWWRPCQLVHINVEDATGLKMKSPVRSLGLEIGYIESVILSDTHVDLGICITERVDVLPTTRAYIRGEGFLGDKFVELKPVRYIGPGAKGVAPEHSSHPASHPATERQGEKSESRVLSVVSMILDSALPKAYAQDGASAAPPTGGTPVREVVKEVPQENAPVQAAERPRDTAREGSKDSSVEGSERRSSRQIPVGEGTQDIQNLVKRVDSLVGEMTNLTTHLKQAINPEELRETLHQLNRTLENASRTLSPESGLNQTAQRTLAKLEDAIEQMRAMATRINQGQGSVGMLLNDPSYAEEIRQILKNANRLLSKVGSIRFVPDIGGEKILGYDTGRGWFRLMIWPKQDRYYLLGISLDPRGGESLIRETNSVPGGAQTVFDRDVVEKTRILLTGMLGKVFFDRLDLAVGALNGDGAVSAGVFLGPKEDVERYQVHADLYSHGSDSQPDCRIFAMAKVFMGAYVRVGLESLHQVRGLLPVSYGAGVSFDDDDIKLLFALR